MSDDDAPYRGLGQLGGTSALPASPDEAVIEKVANPRPDETYVVRFTAPEFTCLCPVTGQPDFAHLVIDYVPDAAIVESKSLKLYLGSFRNHGALHEATTVAIARRLVDEIAPVWLRIGGYWYPARRHADRCLLPDGRAARGAVAARYRRRALPRARIIAPLATTGTTGGLGMGGRAG